MKSATPSPELAAFLDGEVPAWCHRPSEIEIQSVAIAMRDGTLLATDLYLPPCRPVPVIVSRTPYGRASDKLVTLAMTFARRGYAVVVQDCRGTGDSEPANWDYYVYEAEDGPDLVAWIAAQPWCDGFIGGFGGSYAGQTQWCMATHEAMSAIAPEVSGLGVAASTVGLHMFISSYAESVGKGSTRQSISHAQLEKIIFPETLSTGLFNAPIDPPMPAAATRRFPHLAHQEPAEARRELWEHYAVMDSRERATFIRSLFSVEAVSIAEVESLPGIFGQSIAHDAHTLPSADRNAMAQSIKAPALMITGWYDWGLPDALATWKLMRRAADPAIADDNRLIISPASHSGIGYREGMTDCAALRHSYRSEAIPGLLLHWFDRARDQEIRGWPTVIYYLMGANEWRTAVDWPPPNFTPTPVYLAAGGRLTPGAPDELEACDWFDYDPGDPTPTIGGSILSSVIAPGSVDVREIQKRDDVLSFTSPAVSEDLDVVGPLRMCLFASSSARDTDFSVRLSDVFPDGRAIQLQSGILRARHRGEAPETIEPGRVYQFDIDMWATANRFLRGHRIRIDIASADFPRFERNTNLGGEPGKPVVARQTIFRDRNRPSHVMLPIPAGVAPATVLGDV